MENDVFVGDDIFFRRFQPSALSCKDSLFPRAKAFPQKTSLNRYAGILYHIFVSLFLSFRGAIDCQISSRSSPVVNPAALAPQGSTLLGASGVPMAHCKLQGNRSSKLRWHTFPRCWFQTNKTAQAACGSTRGMDRAGIGVFSEGTGACRELKIHHFLPFDCDPPRQYNLWGFCSFYFA